MTNGSRSKRSLQRPTQIGHDFPHVDTCDIENVTFSSCFRHRLSAFEVAVV